VCVVLVVFKIEKIVPSWFKKAPEIFTRKYRRTHTQVTVVVPVPPVPVVHRVKYGWVSSREIIHMSCPHVPYTLS
jgi:hypothetical protein